MPRFALAAMMALRSWRWTARASPARVNAWASLLSIHSLVTNQHRLSPEPVKVTLSAVPRYRHNSRATTAGTN
jgi:hypothetical protein